MIDDPWPCACPCDCGCTDDFAIIDANNGVCASCLEGSHEVPPIGMNPEWDKMYLRLFNEWAAQVNERFS
jgi:hypothetical protein